MHVACAASYWQSAGSAEHSPLLVRREHATLHVAVVASHMHAEPAPLHAACVR